LYSRIYKFLKKGVLELCVLSVLHTRDSYGYDVSEYISKKIEISDGTVYPILRKLKSEGKLTTYLSEESGGPPRKYYQITELGKNEFETEKAEWLGFIKTVMKMLEGENHNEQN